MARRGRLREWHGTPPPAPRAPRLFWSVTTVVVAGGLVATVLLPGGHGASVAGVRMLFAIAGGLLAGTVAVRLTAHDWAPGVRTRPRPGNDSGAAAGSLPQPPALD
jgi:hypothetical protein